MAAPAPAQPLGIVGLGLLGSALAERALAAGIPVLGHDLDPARAASIAHPGFTPAPDAAAVFAACRRILLVLPHDGIVRDVLRPIPPSLLEGRLVLDASTGDPEASVALSRELAGGGATYLDSTVSGSSNHVRRGEALFLVGGDADAFRAAEPLLTTLAGRALHVGGPGDGARMKLVTNLVLGLNRAALAEGLAFASATGLDPARTLDVLLQSPACSRIMDTKGPRMVAQDFAPEARLSQHLKDVRLILAAAAAAGQETPLSRAHAAWLERAESLGLGPLDNSALILALARNPPVPPAA